MPQHTSANVSRRLGTAAAVIAIAGLSGLAPVASAKTIMPPDEAFVEILPGQVAYHSTADVLKQGRPIAPPKLEFQFDQPIHFMKRHVSQAEYAACVADGGCRPLDKAHRDQRSPQLAAVGVSWQDATDYAAWLSKRSGKNYRLPTYPEWVHAAGELFTEELRLDIYDSENPAERWLADYALEAQRKIATDPKLKAFGAYGENASGVLDINGNVWDWTDTCYERIFLGPDGEPSLPPFENCGVRLVAGSHHSMITDFMRDPKAGACSVGIPPSNLGIRLVREAGNS